VFCEETIYCFTRLILVDKDVCYL